MELFLITLTAWAGVAGATVLTGYLFTRFSGGRANGFA